MNRRDPKVRRGTRGGYVVTDGREVTDAWGTKWEAWAAWHSDICYPVALYERCSARRAARRAQKGRVKK
jgi:hypothetical protein